jgi:hypothetical protein
MKRYVLLVIVSALLIAPVLVCGDDEQDEPVSLPSPIISKSKPTARPTSTLGPTVDVSDCILGATFQADVTIPDDTRVEIGQSFVKTWRIRSTGTCDWGPGYRLAFADGDQLNGLDAVSVPEMGGEVRRSPWNLSPR